MARLDPGETQEGALQGRNRTVDSPDTHTESLEEVVVTDSTAQPYRPTSVWQSTLPLPQHRPAQRTSDPPHVFLRSSNSPDPVCRFGSPPVRQPGAADDYCPMNTRLGNTRLNGGLFRELLCVSCAYIVDKGRITVISVTPVSSVSHRETWRISVPRIRDRLNRIERCSPTSLP